MIRDNQASPLILVYRYNLGIHQQDSELGDEALIETYENCSSAMKNI